MAPSVQRSTRKASGSARTTPYSPRKSRSPSPEPDQTAPPKSRRDGSPTPSLDTEPALPTRTQYVELEKEYYATLGPRKTLKALITQAMLREVSDVLAHPQAQVVRTAQFRWWARKMFAFAAAHDADLGVPIDVQGMGLANVVLHDGKPVVVRERIYDVLCRCHAQAGHGGRDRTTAEVRRQYAWIPKELIALFVKACPTCGPKRKTRGDIVSTKRQRKPVARAARKDTEHDTEGEAEEAGNVALAGEEMLGDRGERLPVDESPVGHIVPLAPSEIARGPLYAIRPDSLPPVKLPPVARAPPLPGMRRPWSALSGSSSTSNADSSTDSASTSFDSSSGSSECSGSAQATLPLSLFLRQADSRGTLGAYGSSVSCLDLPSIRTSSTVDDPDGAKVTLPSLAQALQGFHPGSIQGSPRLVGPASPPSLGAYDFPRMSPVFPSLRYMPLIDPALLEEEACQRRASLD